ncbi:MAG: helix-turn-helix transcriptional regulator [Clostridia bacterium]|nr:helix-turn-helix transcriptional regulator [Clostridia bacterium]
MLISEINPFIRYAKKYILLPRNAFLMAPDSRIFFVTEAEKEGLVQIRTDNYPLKANSLFYISANTPYKFKVSGLTKVISINFDFSQYRSEFLLPFDRKPANRNLNQKKKPNDEFFVDYEPLNNFIHLENVDFLLETLNKIIKEYDSMKSYFRETASAMLKLLLIKIINSHEKTISNTNPNYIRNKEVVRKVKKFIHEHYSENLTNETISQHVDYHSYHLNRIFKKLEGISLHKYLNNYRIIMAEKMLLETDETITYIATEVGFDNTISFTQNFKLKNNITPSKYRQYNRGGF